MQRAVVEISAFYDPDPAAVFERVLEAVVDRYGPTTAMINLVDGDRVRYRAALNLPRLLRRAGSLALGDTY